MFRYLNFPTYKPCLYNHALELLAAMVDCWDRINGVRARMEIRLFYWWRFRLGVSRIWITARRRWQQTKQWRLSRWRLRCKSHEKMGCQWEDGLSEIKMLWSVVDEIVNGFWWTVRCCWLVMKSSRRRAGSYCGCNITTRLRRSEKWRIIDGFGSWVSCWTGPSKLFVRSHFGFGEASSYNSTEKKKRGGMERPHSRKRWIARVWSFLFDYVSY